MYLNMWNPLKAYEHVSETGISLRIWIWVSPNQWNPWKLVPHKYYLYLFLPVDIIDLILGPFSMSLS